MNDIALFDKRMHRLSLLLVALLLSGCSEKEVKVSAFETLHTSDYWEPVNASPFGVGKGNEWALMLMDESWRTLIITTYTPSERKGKKASVYLTTSFDSKIREEIKVSSEEEKKLIEALKSLHYQGQQKAFEATVSEFIETLLDRSKFVYEPEELNIEPDGGINYEAAAST